MTDNLSYWVGFSRVPGIGPARLRALLDYYGDVALAGRPTPASYAPLAWISARSENLVKVRSQLDLEAELEKLNKFNISVFTWDSPDYPKLLRNIADSPPILYVRGALIPQDEWALAVVGTRQATSYGKECTRFLVNGLAKNGITIVSGLAYGIDMEAHQTALDAGGRTLAVLGCGVDIIYPTENKKLGQAIIEQGAQRRSIR